MTTGFRTLLLLTFFAFFSHGIAYGDDSLVILNSQVTPFGITPDNTSVTIDVAFGTLPPEGNQTRSITWSVTATPLLHATNPTIAIGPFTETLQGSTEVIDIEDAGATTSYQVYRFSTTFNGLNGGIHVADDRYATSISASLKVNQTVVSSGTQDGMNLAVMWNLGTDSDRESAALTLSNQHMPSLAPSETLSFESILCDDLGFCHVRYQQNHSGLAVEGSEYIAHIDSLLNSVATPTDARSSGIQVSTTPSITQTQALAIALAAMPFQGSLVIPQTAQITVYQDDTSLNYYLAYHTHTEVQSGSTQSSFDHIIDAQNGIILDRYDNLKQVNASAHTRFSGNPTINTTAVSGGYELRDQNIKVFNCKNGSGTDTACTSVFTDTNTNWGDNDLYAGDPNNENGRTFGADAKYVLEKAWAYWHDPRFKRKGYDDNDSPFIAKVHVAPVDPQYPIRNVEWNEGLLAVLLYDGNGNATGKETLATLDTIGHEIAHGVIQFSTHLDSSKQARGIQEATADVFGTGLEWYASNGTDGGDYNVGDKLLGPPIRILKQPSQSLSFPCLYPDFYYPTISNLFVQCDGFPHFIGGPAMHFYYYLSEGVPRCGTPTSCTNLPARSQCGCDNGISPNCPQNKTLYLPCGLPKSTKQYTLDRTITERLWYRALTVFFTKGESYAKARQDMLAAVAGMFKTNHIMIDNVNKAWQAVNVPNQTLP